jgi:cell wall-associated NlpC family hydrolase
MSLRGVPYRDGGSDPSGFDCSGLVEYVFARHGMWMPRTVSEQYRLGQAIDAAALTAGDLVFFSTVSPGPSHVGIVVGADRFLHAPSASGVVRVEHLSSAYWAARFVGARRVP